LALDMPSKPFPVRTTPPAFDVLAFLTSAVVSLRTVRFAAGAVAFAQGAQANRVFYDRHKFHGCRRLDVQHVLDAHRP
jgi:hypothetical protein